MYTKELHTRVLINSSDAVLEIWIVILWDEIIIALFVYHEYIFGILVFDILVS